MPSVYKNVILVSVDVELLCIARLGLRIVLYSGIRYCEHVGCLAVAHICNNGDYIKRVFLWLSGKILTACAEPDRLPKV